MTVKLIGSILVILACGGFGFGIAAAHKREIQAMRDLVHVLSYMECELEYRLTALPDLLEMASKICGGSVSRYFRVMAKELSSQIQPDIRACMQVASDQVTDIPPACREAILQLGQTLGSFGLQGQIEGMKVVRSHCEQVLQKLQTDREKNRRSYETLGICAGAALAIILM